MCVELLIYCFRFFNLAISNLPILFLLLFCFSAFLLFCFFYCWVLHFSSSLNLIVYCLLVIFVVLLFFFFSVAISRSGSLLFVLPPPPTHTHTHSPVYSPPPLPTYLPTHTRIKRGCSSWWRQRTKTLKTQI